MDVKIELTIKTRGNYDLLCSEDCPSLHLVTKKPKRWGCYYFGCDIDSDYGLQLWRCAECRKASGQF